MGCERLSASLLWLSNVSKQLTPESLGQKPDLTTTGGPVHFELLVDCVLGLDC